MIAVLVLLVLALAIQFLNFFIKHCFFTKALNDKKDVKYINVINYINNGFTHTLHELL